MKISRILPLLALAPLLAISACQKAGDAENTENPDAKPGLSVIDGTLVLPVVKGNPGVAYFTLTNSGKAPTTLASVHIDGAGKAEMHETKGGTMVALPWVQLDPGKAVTFERGG